MAVSVSNGSKKKNALFAVITVAGALFVLEAFTSWALMLRMRLANHETFTQTEPTYFSLINLPYKAGVRFGLFDQQLPQDEYRTDIEPSPSEQADAELGYKPLPGRYRVTFSSSVHGSSNWSHLRVNMTQMSDGTRWTGQCESNSRATVYVFGDSFTAGFGVNDEQTFSFLLQQARKDLCVKLFAVEGYGMTQSFILFNKLHNQIKPSDRIVLGYGDMLDDRTMVNPSRLREIEDWFKQKYQRLPDNVMLPRAALDAKGAIRISYVQQRCHENGGYCDQTDPTQDEMTRVTAALINQITELSDAPVYLLHFNGTKHNPIFGLLSGSVRRISALPEDFDYFIRDNILGFDPHPGPWWHYAISRKLIETLAAPIHPIDEEVQGSCSCKPGGP
jgi:hypothetical protein